MSAGICALYSSFFTRVDAFKSEAASYIPECIATRLAEAAIFFAPLRSLSSSLQAKITEHPYRALTLAVGAAAVSMFGYQAWKKYAFDKALTDWVNEVPANEPAKRLEREKRESVKRKIEAYSETTEKTLDLSHSQIDSLPSISVFQALPYLKKLDLSNNPLKIVPEELANLFPQLNELTLTQCQLTALPNSFLNLKISSPNLSWLWLNGNRFTELPKISNHSDLMISIDLDDSEPTKWLYLGGIESVEKQSLLHLCDSYEVIHGKYNAYCQFIKRLQNWYQEGLKSGMSARKATARELIEKLKKGDCESLDLTGNLASKLRFSLELFTELQQVGVEILGL